MTTLNGYEFSPYAEDSVRGDTVKPKSCVVSFFDRPARQGKLIAFLPDQHTLTIQDNRTNASVNFAFDDIRSVLLTDPVDVRRSAEHFKRHGTIVYSIDQQAPFKVVYRDGLEFMGCLRGYGAGHQGFGVYLVVDGANNKSNGICCYFPASSVNTISIEEMPGTLLLKRGDLKDAGLAAALNRQSALREQQIGGLLAEQRAVSVAELDKAIRAQSTKPIKKLGEVLVCSGIINESQLRQALDEQTRRRNVRLGEILTEMGLIEKDVIREVLAQKLGIPCVDLARFGIETKAFRAIPTLLMLQNNAIPLYWSGNDLVVAMKDPLDVRTIDALCFAAHAKIIPVLASKEDIAVALRRGPQDDYALWSHEGVPERVIIVAEERSNGAIAWQSPPKQVSGFAFQKNAMPISLT